MSLAQYALASLAIITLFVIDLIFYLKWGEVNILRIFFTVLLLVYMTLFVAIGEPMTFLALLLTAVLLALVFFLVYESLEIVIILATLIITLTVYIITELV